MDEVVVERAGVHVALVRINRPQVKNALNLKVRELLAEHVSRLAGESAIRCIVLTGNDEAFAAGADLSEMADAGAIEMMLRQTHLLWRAIASCPTPVIAAVNGYAFGGGCELAMHADIIVAGEGAKFGQPEVRVGIMPGAGGTQRLARAVGKFKAMKMVLTGGSVTAMEAERMGLVSEVVPDTDVLSRAMVLAEQIAAMPPLAVTQIKEVLLAGQDASLDAALALERKAFQLLFASRDQKEGMRAFFEKRAPEYEGR
ncbi:MAG: enoyl-CoA hydratase [Bradyrhizobiaceae bacterium]|nr:enoyl-CoA hydratase [Bradyrhizobiaceae bacterium]